MTVGAWVQEMEAVAPAALAEQWDNCGLLCGDPEWELTGVLVCLDVTAEALAQAEKTGLNGILSHHPLPFHPLHTLREDTYAGGLLARLIRGRRALLAAHTNLDAVPGGVNDCLAREVGLRNWSGEGFVRTGMLGPCTAGEALEAIRQRLNPQAVFYGRKDARIERAAVSSGAGGEFFSQAREAGAQLFITGEIHHHQVLEALAGGMQVIAAGHMETERVALAPLAARLREKLPCPVLAFQ